MSGIDLKGSCLIELLLFVAASTLQACYVTIGSDGNMASIDK